MQHLHTHTLSELSDALVQGKTTARALVEQSLQIIDKLSREKQPVFISVYETSALEKADAVDAKRAAGEKIAPYAGIPFAVKDLFDIAGEVTTAGSKILRDSDPATRTAPAIQRLLDQGFILIGKTNMTEFAFSGLGINPHYGTPAAHGSPTDKQLAPGGSSSGAAVSVAAGTVPLSIGTDTAGSCRIPAAWNGVVGYKPTQSLMPLEGAFPLAPVFDAPGPLASSVSCCYAAHQILASSNTKQPEPAGLQGLRIAVPRGVAMSELHPSVEQVFTRSLAALKQAGAVIEHIDIPAFTTGAEIFSTAPLAARQAWELHRERLESHYDAFDPFVALRVSNGKNISEETQQANLAKRTETIAEFSEQMQTFDALLMPTTADIAPELDPLLADLELTIKTNGRALRNTSLMNFVDGCAISIPCNSLDEPAMGLSICHSNNNDERVFSCALAIESLLSTS